MQKSQICYVSYLILNQIVFEFKKEGFSLYHFVLIGLSAIPFSNYRVLSNGIITSSQYAF